MYERMQILSRADQLKIHAATMEVLKDVGIRFHEPEAVEIFKRHGFRTDGDVIHIEEAMIQNALDTAPSQFELIARNPDRSLTIGGNHLAITPGYGAPNMITHDREQRPAVMEDYDNFCKLVQTSRAIDINGCLMVDPSDRPPRSAHLEMLKSNVTLCDKPFLGSSVSRQAATDSVEIAKIAWGRGDAIGKRPVMLGVISSLSPLQYTAEMAGALIEYARNGQVNMIGLLMMAGTTGPVTLPGLLVLQNAEMLAGITLTQLVNPGAPVIYGSTSTVTDMRTGSLATGAPEFPMLQNATIQMGKFYGLPCRGSGGLTDAQYPDIQAGIESALALTTAVMSGANFILHACGILGSYLSMSYEKFLADEEICCMLRRMLQPLDVTDDRIDLDSIKSIGIGNEYLTHPKTLAHFRTEFYLSELMSRDGFDKWCKIDKPMLNEKLPSVLQKRLDEYIKPDISPEIEKDIEKYMHSRQS